MTITHHIADVHPIAVSLVKRGANRQVFFLRKADGALLTEPGDVDDAQLVAMPGAGSLIVKADWSAVYCVVAAPGVEENGGMLAPEVTDAWQDADEIRKAAHSFMRNGALVNRMHEDLQPYGTVVENAVALGDFTVEGQTIAKGSWYIAIEPTEDGREAIESGELGGVSIQGTGVRTPVEKAAPGYSHRTKQAKRLQSEGHSHDKIAQKMGIDTDSVKAMLAKTRGPAGTDIARNEGKQFGPLRHLIAYYLKKDHPFADCVLDNRKRFGPRAEAVCAALKDIGLQTTHWRHGNKTALKKADGGTADAVASIYDAASESWHGRGLSDDDVGEAMKGLRSAERRTAYHSKKDTTMSRTLKKMAAALGIDVDDEIAADEAAGIAKSAPATFEMRIAQRELEEDLPLAMDALRSSIYDSMWCYLYPGNTDSLPDVAEVRASLDTSLQQFHAHVLDQYDDVTAGASPEPVMKALREQLATLVKNERHGATDEEDHDIMGDTNRIDELEKSVGDIKKAVEDLTAGMKPVIEHVAKVTAPAPTVEELTKSVGELSAQLSDIAKGVEQLGTGGSSQSTTATEVAKSNPLAGLLS